MTLKDDKTTQVHDDIDHPQHPHHKKMNSMHSLDTWVIITCIVALWIVLAFVYFTVTEVAQDYSVYIILGIGIVLGIFSTTALLACNVHLTKNKKSLYSTDIMHQRESIGFMKYFDIVFILILCYISLLLPILLRGTVLVGSGTASGMDYTLNPLLLTAVLIATIGYLVFMLTRSDKEMRKVYNIVYGQKEESR